MRNGCLQPCCFLAGDTRSTHAWIPDCRCTKLTTSVIWCHTALCKAVQYEALVTASAQTPSSSHSGNVQDMERRRHADRSGPTEQRHVRLMLLSEGSQAEHASCAALWVRNPKLQVSAH